MNSDDELKKLRKVLSTTSAFKMQAALIDWIDEVLEDRQKDRLEAEKTAGNLAEEYAASATLSQ